MATLLNVADDVLRRAEWTCHQGRARNAIPRLLACVIGFSCVYGATMGAYRGFNGQSEWALQIVYSAIKAPLLLAGAFALTLPTFYVVTSLYGMRDEFGRMVRALAAAQAGLAIALASFAPLTLLVYASTPAYQTALLSSGLMFAVAGLAGQAILRWHCRPLIERNPRCRVMLIVWAAVYALVAIQLAWLLRPFFGAANLPVRFLRPDAWDNAYVVVLRLLWQAIWP